MLQAIVTGTAVSGTAVSLLRIVTKAAFTDSLSGLQLGACKYPYDFYDAG